MIANYKPGMRVDVTVDEHRNELIRRHVNAMESNSRRVAKRMAKMCKEVYGMDAGDEIMLASLARTYGVVKELIPFTVSLTQGFLKGKVV